MSLCPALCPSGRCFQALGITSLTSTWHCRPGTEPTVHQITLLAAGCPGWGQGGNTWLWGTASCGDVQIIQPCWCFAGSLCSQLCTASLIILRLFLLLPKLWICGVLSAAVLSVAAFPTHPGRTEPGILCVRFSVTFLFHPWELVWEGHLVDCWHLSNFFFILAVKWMSSRQLQTQFGAFRLGTIRAWASAECRQAHGWEGMCPWLRDLVGEGEGLSRVFWPCEERQNTCSPLLSAVQGPCERDLSVNLPAEDSPEKNLTLWHRNKKSEWQDCHMM